jgi:hypothetical protein
MRSVRFQVSALVFSVLFSACSGNSLGKAADPPATPVLSRPLGWVVVSSSYAQVFDIPRSSGVVLGYYRKGTVVPVTERKREALGADAVTWLKNEGPEPGWIKERETLVFDSPEKAATAAKTVGK